MKVGEKLEKDMSIEEAKKIITNTCETAEILRQFGIIDVPIYESTGVFEDEKEKQ